MGTVGFFFETDAERVAYSVDFSDETNAAYRTGLIKGTIYPASVRIAIGLWFVLQPYP